MYQKTNKHKNKTKTKQKQQQQQQQNCVNGMFSHFLVKNHFWAYSSYTVRIFHNLRGHANIMTSYEDGWYLLWQQCKEDTHHKLPSGSRVCGINQENLRML